MRTLIIPVLLSQLAGCDLRETFSNFRPPEGVCGPSTWAEAEVGQVGYDEGGADPLEAADEGDSADTGYDDTAAEDDSGDTGDSGL